MADKTVIHYRLDEFHAVYLGRGAIIWPVDHPTMSNKHGMHTEAVISQQGDNFETENHIYVGVHKA